MFDIGMFDDPDNLGGSLRVSHTKTEHGYRGALVGRNGRWAWECLCEPEHASRDEADECGRAEIRRRRGRGSQPFSVR